MVSMDDLSGWRQITCAESEEVKSEAHRVLSSLTDPEGHYGVGVIFTEWGDDDEQPMLRDYLWSDDERGCEHYVPAGPRP